MTSAPPRPKVTTTSLLPLLVGAAVAIALLVVAFVGIGALLTAGSEAGTGATDDVGILDRYEERSPETLAASCVYVDKTVVLPKDGT